MRVYLLLASSDPWMAFYREGYLRRSLHAYTPDSKDRAVYLNAALDAPDTGLALLRLAVRDLEADVEQLSLSAGGAVELTLFAPREGGATHAKLFSAVTTRVRGSTPGGRSLPPRSVSLVDTTSEALELDELQTARTSYTLEPGAYGRLVPKRLCFWYVADGGALAEPVRSERLYVDLVP